MIEYTNTCEGEFYIVWKRDSSIEGKMQISNTTEIEGQVNVIKVPKNKMEAMFDIIWEKSNDLPAQIKVSFQDDTLNGHIKVHKNPKNKMEAEFGVTLPERKTVELSVIKDTYVTELKPTLNFGKSSIIKVGTDKEGNKYRSLLQYEIPIKLQQMRITKAYIKLYSDDDNDFKNMEISLPYRGWGEYNVVWYGQPSRLRIVDVINLGKQYEYTIDVTDLVKHHWILYPYENFGLILKSENEDIIQMKNFGTKESDIPSKLCIEYFDEDLFNTTGSVLNGHIKVQRTEWSDLIGEIGVHRDWDESLLKGHIHVHNMNMIEGHINNTAMSSIYGHVLPERLHNDMEGEVFSCREKLHGKIITRAFSGLYGSVKPHLNSKINGFVNVVYKNDILGRVKIRPLEQDDLAAQMIISDKQDINGSLNVIYKSDLKGEIEVKPLERNQINGQLKIATFRDILGNIGIIYKNQIDGKITVKYKNDLYACVRPMYFNEQSDLKGLVLSRCKTEINGRIIVNPVGFNGRVHPVATTNIKGRIKVRATKELYGQVTSTLKNDVDGYVRVRLLEISDLYAHIYSKGKPCIQDDYIYAFIM